MELTQEQLNKITELSYAQKLPSTFPSEDELEFMETIAEDMTLDQYLAMPDKEKAKWRINYNPGMELMELAKAGKVYAPFYFEPVTEDIRERIY